MKIYPGNATVTKHTSFPRCQKKKWRGRNNDKTNATYETTDAYKRTATGGPPWNGHYKNYFVCWGRAGWGVGGGGGSVYAMWREGSMQCIPPPNIANLVYSETGVHRGNMVRWIFITVSVFFFFFFFLVLFFCFALFFFFFSFFIFCYF